MHIFPELLRTTVTGNEEGNMRNGRKIISLLLVAVMTVALLPVAATADPPKGDTHLHSWYVKAETPATCTERGTKTWKCTLCGQQYSEVYKPLGHDWDEGRVTTAACEQEGVKTYTCRRCGATYTEAIPVTGHDWDEGVITAEPQGLTPGIKTYTCRHDASHIRTEEIDPLEYLFGWLHTGNVAIVPYDFDPIIIIEQPKDGTITRNTDETHTMHVAAIGGSGNYTYEWHSNTQEVFQEGVANDFIKWLGGLFGASEEEIDTALHASLSDTDTLTVGDGEGVEKYSCTVSDDAGNSEKSEWAFVTYKLRIAEEPSNVNLQSSENPTLYCRAADGSGDYTYRWYTSENVFVGKEQFLPVSELGDYFCTVEDNVTGESIDSSICTVYSEKPLAPYSQTPYDYVWPGEKWTVNASFWGGVEPYEVWWTYKGDALDTYEGMQIYGHQEYSADTYETGTYIAHAVDAMVETATAIVERWEKTLTITEQPIGKLIPKGGTAGIRTAVADGEAPYSFQLYRNGMEYVEATHDFAWAEFPIYYPGEYYFRITDSQGHYADSDAVIFSDDIIRIKSQTESEVIIVPNGTADLFVEAEGGTKPYTYQWLTKWLGRWYRTGESSPTYQAGSIRDYACIVWDDDKQFAISNVIPVKYTGACPWIRIQPVGGSLKKDAAPPVLSCHAITAEGHGIRYEWYKGSPGIYFPSWSMLVYDSQYITAPGVGLYRCKVVDTYTNGYVWSDIVEINEELAFDSIELVYKWENCARYHVSFKGGTAPYTVKLYLRVPVDTQVPGKAWDYVDALRFKQTVNSRYQLSQLQYTLDFGTIALDYREDEGEYISEYMKAEYKVVVYDANNNKAESPYFSVRDLNIIHE